MQLLLVMIFTEKNVYTSSVVWQNQQFPQKLLYCYAELNHQTLEEKKI